MWACIPLQTMKRIPVLLLLIELGLATASAQDGGGSPYSAYGLGDLFTTGQATQAMMAGGGLALTEPYSVVPGNPAAYPSLLRPVFEVGMMFRNRTSSSTLAQSTGKDAKFMGFSLGVPFGKGNWGLAFGLTPLSEVDYALAREGSTNSDPVQYKYTGSGGLDRAFVGLGRNVYRQQLDSLENLGHRVDIGADFNFIFGSLDQRRDAIYSRDAGYSNVRAFSTMILRAPALNLCAAWQGDLTRKKHRDDGNWRWTVGLSASLPVEFSARYREEVYTYVTGSGIESIRDTVSRSESKGTIRLPIGTGIAVGANNDQWGLTAEVRQRNWGTTEVDVPAYSMAAPMQDALSYLAAARFRPSSEGGVLARSVYRLGVRYDQQPQQVHGQGLGGAGVSAGVSIPLNMVQTNSWLHIGGEFGQRGTTENGLLRERHLVLWVGLAFTPWRGERWFTPSKIQ